MRQRTTGAFHELLKRLLAQVLVERLHEVLGVRASAIAVVRQAVSRVNLADADALLLLPVRHGHTLCLGVHVLAKLLFVAGTAFGRRWS